MASPVSRSTSRRTSLAVMAAFKYTAASTSAARYSGCRGAPGPATRSKAVAAPRTATWMRSTSDRSACVNAMLA
jgi:hypothetical protein